MKWTRADALESLATTVMRIVSGPAYREMCAEGHDRDAVQLWLPRGAWRELKEKYDAVEKAATATNT